MTVLRRYLFQHRVLAIWLVALALAMKALIPAGYMPAADGQMIVQLCTESGPDMIVVAVPGLKHGESGHESKADMPCAFSGLAAPLLGSIPPALIAAAIVFILALGLRPLIAPVSAITPFLRPPLRGPPAFS
ncbi:DUF2946 family protein [Allosphingosinicella vermicomposti]|uniref:DUF2946 family protein n=1 Tax=Allosphingosinicella vermicomposti TaxID=614671 RepID=UPI001FE21109|nr:DUF2946 family protein [Allosphingosinicella vermicomposti]